jgi:shikimate dehydrogenase
MKRLAIIGDPIGHSISPSIYNATFPVMQIDATYEAWLTPAKEVAEAIERLRADEMMGMNVTVPHKEAVLELVDEVEPGARAIGAVNCITKRDGKLVGHNTDKVGFIESLRAAGFDPRGQRALILGVGGSARAICVGLIEADASTITLAGRRPEAVDALAAHLRAHYPQASIDETSMEPAALEAASAAAALVVNCTPVGMYHTESEGQSPLPQTCLREGLWVCDLIYRPPLTRLLLDAESAGCHTLGGLEMLVLQAVESVRLWTDREPPVDVMRVSSVDELVM